MCTSIQKEFNRYAKNKYVVFGITLGEVINKSGEAKKDYKPPPGWQNSTLDSVRCFPGNNGLAMVTGKISGVFVIDIDDVDDWKMLLEKEKQEEPKTAKAISGNNGIHFYFKYTEKIAGIVTNAKSIKYKGKALGIDIRTNKGMIITPPTSYPSCKDAKIKKTYTWERSIFDCELLELPEWLHKLLCPMAKIVQSVSDTTVSKRDTEVSSKRDIEASIKRDTEVSSKRDIEASIKRDTEVSSKRDTEASIKRDTEVSIKREIKKNKGIDQFGFPESDDDTSLKRTKEEIEREIEREFNEKIDDEMDEEINEEIIKKSILKTKKNSEEKVNEKKIVIQPKNTMINTSSKTTVAAFDNEELMNELIKSKNKYTQKEIEELVNYLNVSRADNYDDWTKVGMCLKNMNSAYVIIWDDWSQKSNKYVKGECLKKWNTFKSSSIKGYTVGSLIMWVKEDNLVAFEDFKKKCQLEKCLNGKKEYTKALKSNVEITSFQLDNNQYYARLKNTHCPIVNAEHVEHIVRANGYLSTAVTAFACNILCEVCGKIYFPCKHMSTNKDGVLIQNNDNNMLFTNNEINMLFPNLNINNYQNCTFNNVNNKTNNTNDTNIEDIFLTLKDINVFEDKILNEAILQTLKNPTSSFMAELIYYINKDDYAYCKENKHWYQFEDHRWIKINAINFVLRNNSTKQLYSCYDKIIEYLVKNNYTSKIISKIRKIVQNCSETLTKNNIMTELTELFALKTSRSFLDNLDDNPNLIGFTNGIFDLETMTFRKGIRTDYVTMTVGYDYKNTFGTYLNDIQQFFKDIMPDDEQREYLLTLLGSLLLGINQNETFNIFTGAMRNGKSTLSNLLKITLGDYYGNMHSSFFTKERPSMNTPQPDLFELLKKRVIITSECEANQRFNTGFIKLITGNDSLQARALYSNDIVSIDPRFKLIMLCNDIPEVDRPHDIAFWVRCKCVKYPISFVENPVGENERKLNTNLKTQLVHWKYDMMLLLLGYCENFMKNGIKFTKQIEEFTQLYQNSTDPYLSYVKTYLVKEIGNCITWKKLREHFLAWYVNNVSQKPPKFKDIKTYFETKIFKFNQSDFSFQNNTIHGWKDWTILDNDNDGNLI